MKALAPLLILIAANVAAAAGSPWHFRGIYVGAKMSRDQIMQQLGAPKYANNPDTSPWKGCNGKTGNGDCAFTHYGMHGTEWVEFHIGPLCENSDIEQPGGFLCLNPLMISSSVTGHGISGVEVFARADGTVGAIDISFDSSAADDFFDVAHRQFDGAGTWQHDPGCEGPMVIRDENPKAGSSPITVQRVCETLTTKHFRAYMTNYDEIFTHATPPLFRGILELKLLDQEL